MSFYASIRPLIFKLDPEKAHSLGLTLASGISRVSPLLSIYALRHHVSHPCLQVKSGDLLFDNPIGLAAGLDKNATALPFWQALGFGFIEAGTATAHAQPGQDKPRLFRVPDEKAIVNRLGFPNQGAEKISATIKTHKLSIPLGINIGKSKIAPIEEAVSDYLKSFTLLAPYADYVTINVSSPNTPGLRDMQTAKYLLSLFDALNQKNKELVSEHGITTRPIFVKISPDLSPAEIEEVTGCALEKGLHGIIATNTHPTSGSWAERYGAGGISGRPIYDQSNDVIRRVFRQVRGRLLIVGCGGIFTAEDAYCKIKAGASLVQLYTGLIYEGPNLITQINRGLIALLQRDGISQIEQAVGIDV